MNNGKKGGGGDQQMNEKAYGEMIKEYEL